MGLEHPAISHTRRFGYPNKEDMQTYGNDILGNALYLYDDVIAMPEGIYRVDSLSDEEIHILLENGGIYQQME